MYDWSRLYVRFTFLICFLAFACCIPDFGKAQSKDSAVKYTLDMRGKMLFDGKRLAEVTIDVYIDTFTLYRTVTSDAKGGCSLELLLNRFYTVRVSKKGFVAKIITADTHTPKQLPRSYLFEFTVELFEEIPELNVSILRYPIAKIMFNAFTRKFDYDYNYTVKINNDIKAMYHDYHLLKSKGNVCCVARNDSLVAVIPPPVKSQIPISVHADSINIRQASGKQGGQR